MDQKTNTNHRYYIQQYVSTRGLCVLSNRTGTISFCQHNRVTLHVNRLRPDPSCLSFTVCRKAKFRNRQPETARTSQKGRFLSSRHVLFFFFFKCKSKRHTQLQVLCVKLLFFVSVYGLVCQPRSKPVMILHAWICTCTRFG